MTPHSYNVGSNRFSLSDVRSRGEGQNVAWRAVAEAKLISIFGLGRVAYKGGPYFEVDGKAVVFEALTYNSPAHLKPTFTVLTRRPKSIKPCFQENLEKLLENDWLMRLRVDGNGKLRSTAIFDLAEFARALMTSKDLLSKIMLTNKIASGGQKYVTIDADWLPNKFLTLLFHEADDNLLIDSFR